MKTNIWDVKLFCDKHYFLKKDYSKLKRPGIEYLKSICNVCESNHEREFNTWIMGPGMELRVGDDKQEILVHCILVQFLNARHKEERSKNENR